jgi:hypothetical protein
MRRLLSLLFLLMSLSALPAQAYEPMAAELLRCVREGLETADLERQLAEADPRVLTEQLDSDAEKKAFWINLYNSFIILRLRENPALFDDRGRFFGEPRVRVAGLELSFDQIEHGYLRRSQVKLGLGFLGKLFLGPHERDFRVEAVDPRIHFALNCGARSCPPVEIYRAATIDAQLEARARAYLAAHARYSPESKQLLLTPLVSWFRGDFGGLEGAVALLKRYGLLPPEADPSLEFEDYDWTLDIQNFAEAAQP